MIGKRFGEPRDLNRMKSREFATRRFQLDRCRISCEITNVGPVEHFNRLARAHKSGRRESSPKSLQTDVSSGHSPVAGSFDESARR